MVCLSCITYHSYDGLWGGGYSKLINGLIVAYHSYDGLWGGGYSKLINGLIVAASGALYAEVRVCC